MEKTNMNKNFFRKPVFLLIIIALTMFNNLEHGAELYYRITGPIYPDSWLPYIHLQAYFVIIVIDLAVIGFIVNGKTKDSKAFAFLLFLINLLFWDVLTGISKTSLWDLPNVSLLIAKIFFSAAFSYLIHKMSSLYFERVVGYSSIEQLKAVYEQELADKKQLAADFEQQKAEVKTACEALEFQRTQNRTLEEKTTNCQAIISRIEHEFTCQHCNEYKADHLEGIATALKALNAHRGVCLKKVTTI
ncbi:MAG TPA: hypothetical protein VGC65_00280 [Bacteroidia bacterium]|jgi:hypothetical protein